MRRSIKIFVVVVLITGMSLGVFVPSAPGYAVALVDDFIIAITALASTMGIDFGITGGWDVYRNFMAGELETYAAGAGTTLPGILGDAKIGHGQSGRLIIDNPTLLKMRTIIAALTATWGLVNNQSKSLHQTSGYRFEDGESLVFSDIERVYDGRNFQYYFSDPSSVQLLQFGADYILNDDTIFSVMFENGICYFVVNGNRLNVGSRDPSQFNYYSFGYYHYDSSSPYTLGLTFIANNNIAMVATASNPSVWFGQAWPETVAVETTTIDIPSAEDVGTKGVAVSVGAVAGASYADVLEAIQTGVLAGDLTAAATYEDEAELEQDLVVTPNYSAGDYQSPGLQAVFPFCIPFDIYNFVTALAADPVAPSFDVPFVIPGLVDYTFHLDLSAFNSVASILRTLELLAFCVGLAFVTRHLIRG